MPRGFSGGDFSKIQMLGAIDQAFTGLMDQFSEKSRGNLQMEAWKMAMQDKSLEEMTDALKQKFPNLKAQDIMKEVVTASAFKEKMAGDKATRQYHEAQAENLRKPDPDPMQLERAKTVGRGLGEYELRSGGFSEPITKNVSPGSTFAQLNPQGTWEQLFQAPAAPRTPDQAMSDKLRKDELSLKVAKATGLANLLKQMPSENAPVESRKAWTDAMNRQGYADKIPKTFEATSEQGWRNQYSPDMAEEEMVKWQAEGYKKGFLKTPPKSKADRIKNETELIATSVGVDLSGPVTAEDAKKVIAAVTQTKKERLKDGIFQILATLAATGKFDPSGLDEEFDAQKPYDTGRLDQLRGKQ